MNKTPIKTIITQWLRQLLILWLVVNVYDAIYFVYRLNLLGELTAHYPMATEMWQRFWNHNMQQPTTLYIILVTLLAEINYQYFFKRYKWYIFTTSVLLTAIFSIAAFTLFANDRYEINLLEPFALIAGYAFGYTLLSEFLYHRWYNLKLRAERFENELRALKQQLNPHFLFNTLNYLYGTALQENASRTAEGIDMMAEMMRYTVTGMQENYTPLSAEIQFIEQYLQLQRLRMPVENAKLVTADIQAANAPLFIAPLLLMPFIENAFKYGINNDRQTPVKIAINLKGDELQMEVNNTILNNQAAIPGTNSGLALTRKRLDLLYRDKYNLDISAQQHVFNVRLTLRLNA